MKKKSALNSQKMVPLSFFMSYFVSLSNFFILNKQASLLPALVYRIFGVWQQAIPIMSLIMVGSDKVWANNESIRNIFIFFQVFWRFGAQFTESSEFFISFLVIIGLNIVGFIPTFVGHLIWRITDKFNSRLFIVINVLHEIVLPLVNSWVPSQLASVIEEIVNHESQRTLFNYISVACYVIILLLHIAFTFYFVSCDMIYMKGRSISWGSGIRIALLCWMIAGTILTRLVETLSKIPSIIMAVLTVINYVFNAAFIIERQAFLSPTLTATYPAVIIGFLVGFILQCISMYASKIDIMIVIVAILISISIAYILLNMFITKRTQLSLHILDMIEADESLFEQLIPNPSVFLRIARIGFQNGHKYILTWRPFLNAHTCWPNQKAILIQYIKFVAIYYDEDQKLVTILQMLKKFRDFPTSQLRREIKLIRESRDIHLTRALKMKLKSVDERAKLANNLIVSFWNAIEDNNPNSAFDISLKLSKVVEHVHADFLYYSSMSPNNWVIPSQYANFLLNIICDPEEGQYWSRRSRFLRGKKTMLYDAAQAYGFETFPLIPRTLDPQPPEHLDMIATTQSVSTNTSLSSGSSLELDKVDDGNDIDNIDITPSGILKMGERAHVTFVLWPLLFTCIFFILAFVIIPFTPEGLYRTMSTKIQVIYTAIIAACDIENSIHTIAYLLTEKALQLEELIPNNQKISEILNSSVSDTTSLVNSEIEKLNSNIHVLLRQFGSVVGININSWNYIQSVSIPMTLFSQNSTKSYNASFTECLNILASMVYKFSSINQGNFIDEEWYLFFMNNYPSVPSYLTEAIELMSRDASDIITDFLNTVDITFSAFIALEIVILPVFIFLSYRIKGQWNSIVSIFNSIPRVAIHKVIQDHTTNMMKENALTNRSEFRYLSTFSQMVVSRDTTSGVPITMIICFGFFNFVVSVASCIILATILRSYNEQIEAIPMTYFYSADTSAALFYFSELVLRTLTYFNGNPFGNDTFEFLNSSHFSRNSFLKNATSKIMTTTWNNIQVGFTITTQDIVDHFFQSRGMSLEQMNEFIRLQQLPRFLTINIMNSLLIDLYHDLVSANTYNYTYSEYFHNSLGDTDYMYSLQSWSKLKTISDQVVQDLIGNALMKEKALMNTSLTQIETYLVLISVLMLIIGSMTISLVIYKLLQVQNSVRFVLSSLSMIDHRLIQDMPSIMNLFNGKVTKIAENNRTLQLAYETVDRIIQEPVIQLDIDLSIISINNAFAKSWKIEPEMYLGTPLESFMNFEDKKILSSIFKQAESEINKQALDKLTFETKITLKATSEERNIIFTSIKFHNEKGFSSTRTRVILFFHKTSDRAKNLATINDLSNANNEIKNTIIPEQIRHRINVSTHKLKFMPRHIVIVSIDIINFNEYCNNHQPTESKNFFKKLQNFLDKQCNLEKRDAIKLKVIGTTTIIVFNLGVQISNYYSAVFDALALVKEVAAFSRDNGYQTRYSMVIGKKSIIKLSTNGILRLDMYTRKIKEVLILLSKSTDGNLLLGPKALDIIPEEIKKDGKKIKYFNETKKVKYAAMIDVLSFS